MFDLHAYENWLIDTSVAQIEDRIAAVKNEGIALFFGELGRMNAGTMMGTADFRPPHDAGMFSSRRGFDRRTATTP